MCHGDDAGLRLPPVLAPIQVVVLIVRDDEGVRRAAESIAGDLRAAGWRVRLDDRVETSFGRRSVEWELKGVPVRVEVGPRDLAEGRVTLVRRDRQEKSAVALAGVAGEVGAVLEEGQRSLFSEAEARREARTQRAGSLQDAVAAASQGFGVIGWDAVGVDGEEELAREGVSVRCLRREDGSLASSDDEPGLQAVVARAY
jgi:prolyl-tRNA synthetase